MKFIKTLDQFLNESYENINDLNSLTIDMLKILANHIAKCNILNDDIYLYNPLKLLNIKYTTDIQKFIDSRYLKYISLVTLSKEPDIKGLYDQNSQGIKLVTKLDKDSIGILMSKNEENIDSYLYKILYSTLLHELQHTFDDFRSDGKFHNQKEYTSNLNKLDKYVNIKAELDANFTATVVRLFYYDEKYIDTPTSEEDGIVIVERIIKDFNVIKNQFIDKYPSWYRLNQENKKDLIYQLGKYYIRKKEEIDIYNKEKNLKDFN